MRGQAPLAPRKGHLLHNSKATFTREWATHPANTATTCQSQTLVDIEQVLYCSHSRASKLSLFHCSHGQGGRQSTVLAPPACCFPQNWEALWLTTKIHNNNCSDLRHFLSFLLLPSSTPPVAFGRSPLSHAWKNLCSIIFLNDLVRGSRIEMQLLLMFTF